MSSQGSNEKVGAVLVVGGGIGGIQAALDLAESGYKVYLVEESPAIGGRMAQLDKTFPTNDCAMCILSPKLVECGRHLNIELLTYSQILDAQGVPGNFKVKVLKRARSVDESLCTGCGVCQEKCPWKTESEFEQGLAQRKAIYILYAQAMPNIPVIDREICAYFQRGKCRACEKFCPAHAIDFSQTDQELEIQAGAIILAPGYEIFDPRLRGEYGYGRYKNVITSLEFERILSASGPYQGEILRPGDKKHPKRIAWIQCVGSRDQSLGRGFCSSVCCMYAIKEAIIAREHQPDLDLTILYNDIRTFGKGFEEYYENAKKSGIRFVRSIISGVKELQQSKNLLLSYVADGQVKEEEFDLVVLSVGLRIPERLQELGRRLGLDLNQYGFCWTEEFNPVQTSRPGVFVCGAFQGPKDIPETVMQASAAAANSSALLSPARHTLTAEKEYPPERDVSGEPPRIGVFVCHCGINIGAVVNVPEVVEYAKTLPNVVYAEDNLYTCSQDSQERIKEKIREHNLNRVVVASCTPRTHEPLFQETIREAGLNKFLFEMANIRDQCSWVHMHEPEKATQKAKDLVRMAVARAVLLEPLQKVTLGLNHNALVIGGGIAGMSAALTLAEQGFKTYLVEKEEELGGWARKIHVPLNEKSPQGFLRALIEKVKSNELIEVFTATKVVKSEGFVGNFKTTVANKEGERVIEHGATIVAIGAKEYRGEEYLLGQDKRVLTLGDLEEKIGGSPEELAQAKDIAMILCVRPQNGNFNYCSRICCTVAIKNALKLKEINPEANIYVLYRDIRTYGFKEELYTKARRQGILFLRYPEESPPQVSQVDGRLKINTVDLALGEQITLSPDLLVLAMPIVPSDSNEELSQLLKVPLTKEGFFLEAHVKLAPVDFSFEGIFMCGMAHFPKLIDEAVAQAQAAAGRAATILAKPQLEVGGAICQVEREKCRACLTCVRVCPFNVPYIDEEGKAVIEMAKCRGCGICAAECPQKAIKLLHYKEDQVIAKTEALFA